MNGRDGNLRTRKGGDKGKIRREGSGIRKRR
jgi:hypothetical protein